MANKRPRETPNGSHRSRCLLLVPRGLDAPLNLIDGLRFRKVVVRQVADPYAVMVALADVGPQRPKVVVIVEPGIQSTAESLVSAMRQYHADVAIWRYDPTQRPGLAPWPAPKSETETAIKPPTKPMQATPTQTAAVVDQHVNEPWLDDRSLEGTTPYDDETAADDDDLDQPLISDEELAMLLGSDEPDPHEKE